jgi:hypothetical protein
VAQIIEYMKGKSSIWIAQNVERKMRNFLGHKFWARVLCDDRWPERGSDPGLLSETKNWPIGNWSSLS